MKTENVCWGKKTNVVSAHGASKTVIVNQFTDLQIFDTFTPEQQKRALVKLADAEVVLAPDGRSVMATPEFANVIHEYLPMLDSRGK